MKANVFIVCCLLLSCISRSSFAQDTLATSSDTTKAVKDTSLTGRRANKAALFSAVIPGTGQIYNKKYWKPPILYAGLIALGYSINFNNKNYQIFKKAYLYRVDGDSTTVDNYETVYPDANALLVRKDYYRRTRDLMWIILSGVYVLNIIDAYVDGQLSDFDISDDLSMKAQPGLQFAFGKTPVPSLALTFRIH
jgi:hypothetical protein